MVTNNHINSNFYQIAITDVNGNVTGVITESIDLTDVSGLQIGGGANGQALISDGTGNVFWGNVASGNASYANFAGVANGVARGNVTGAGNVGQIQWSSASGNLTSSDRYWISASGAGALNISRDGGPGTGVAMYSYSNQAGIATTFVSRARGTKAAPLPVQVGDRVFSTAGHIYTGTGTTTADGQTGWSPLSPAAYMAADVTALPTSPSTTYGSKLSFAASNAVTNSTQVMTFNDDGSLTVPGQITTNGITLGNIVGVNFNGNGSQSLRGNGQWAYNNNITSSDGFSLIIGNAGVMTATTPDGQSTINFSNTGVAIGTSAGSQSTSAVAIGWQTGQNNQGESSIAIGKQAGFLDQGYDAVAVGTFAGAQNQGDYSVALGGGAGAINQGANSTAIGQSAGSSTQGNDAVAIGTNAGTVVQGVFAISVGSNAGRIDQGNYSVAIGANAATNNQGNYSVAIGAYSGQENQPDNTIILNASGFPLGDAPANSFTVRPVRNVTGNAEFTVSLYYNPTTGEIGYKTA